MKRISVSLGVALVMAAVLWLTPTVNADDERQPTLAARMVRVQRRDQDADLRGVDRGAELHSDGVVYARCEGDVRVIGVPCPIADPEEVSAGCVSPPMA